MSTKRRWIVTAVVNMALALMLTPFLMNKVMGQCCPDNGCVSPQYGGYAYNQRYQYQSYGCSFTGYFSGTCDVVQCNGYAPFCGSGCSDNGNCYFESCWGYPSCPCGG
jgi:hypothetical protein